VGDAEEDRLAAQYARVHFVGFKTEFECPARMKDHREILGLFLPVMCR